MNRLMKTFAMGVMIGSMSMIATPSFAADDAPRPERRRSADGQRPERPAPGDRPEGDRGEVLHRILGELNLTEDQKPKVKEVISAHGDAVKAYMEAHRAEFQAIEAKIKAAREAKNREAMAAAMEELRALREGGPSRDAVHQAIKGILTPEQNTKFDELIAKMKERREGDGPRPRPRGDKPAGDPEL